MMAAPLPEADRRRLVEVRGLHPAVPVLVLHPLLSVVTGFGRDASDTVVECLGRLGAPLGPSVTGTVEIGGRILDLPGALSDPGARPEVVRAPMLVSEIGRRRAADAAMDISQRAARVSRREAGLARRDQLVDRLEQLSNRADALERQLEDGETASVAEVERLLVAARLPDPASPNPIIAALIDEWDALHAERKAISGGLTVERAEAHLDAIRARIAERESDVDGVLPEVLDADGVARVQAAHAVVERHAAGLEDARRSERKAAGREVAAALEVEQAALADLGFDSYAAFLMAVAEGRAEDDAAHDEAALTTAESALARAHEREHSFVVLSERELDLRTRVARLLGRLPGPDVGAELRSGRESVSVPSGARDRLEAVLRAAGVPYGDDPVAGAERWLEASGSRRAQNAALRAELAEIESEGARLDEQLEMAENELAAAERELIASVSGSLAGREAPLVLGSVEPHEVTAAVTKLVAPAGPPVVIGECFAELSPQSCAALLETLGAMSRRRQVIVVTEHDAVGRWALGMGLDGLVWTPAEAEAAQRALRNGHTPAAPITETPVESTVDTAAESEVAVEPEVAVDVAVEPEGAEAAEPADSSPADEAPPKAKAPLFDIDAVEAAEAANPPSEPEDTAAEVRNDIFASPESREAIDAKFVDPGTSRSSKARRPQEPSTAPGPWKGQRRARRKNKHQPPAPPWEGRFDTSREREMPSGAIPAFPIVPGSAPLAVCVRHNGAITRNRCAVCKQPACDECLMKPWPRRKAICIECAILEAGVRKRRRLRG